MVFDAIVIASCVLLRRAHTYPHDDISAEDVRLTEPSVKLLTMLAAKTGSSDLMGIQLNCEVLFERANKALRRN